MQPLALRHVFAFTCDKLSYLLFLCSLFCYFTSGKVVVEEEEAVKKKSTSRLVAAKMALLLRVSRVLHRTMSLLNEVYSLDHILTPNGKKPLSFSPEETNKREADVASMTHLSI